MKTYDETLTWIARESYDDAPMYLVAFLFDKPVGRVQDDYREVKKRMYRKQPHQRVCHVEGWRTHPRALFFICEREGCHDPGGRHVDDPEVN